MRSCLRTWNGATANPCEPWAEHPVLLENAYVTVTMADGTVYEMSFPEGNRGSSWSIFQIENGTFRVLDIVEEILAIHRE